MSVVVAIIFSKNNAMRLLLFMIIIVTSGGCAKRLSPVISKQPLIAISQQNDSLTYVVTYNLTYQSDSLTDFKKNVVFKLRTSMYSSVFESLNNHAHDSLVDATPTPNGIGQVEMLLAKAKALGFNDFPYVIYKNQQAKIITSYEQIGAPYYRYAESFQVFNWQLQNSHRTIVGYDCQLAETQYAGRHFKAWFTRAIPVSDGPYKFCGLPGLILDIIDTQGYYHFSFQGIISNTKHIKLELSKVRKVISATREQVREGNKSLTASYVERRTARGDKISEEEKARYRERARRKNNPLELR